MNEQQLWNILDQAYLGENSAALARSRQTVWGALQTALLEQVIAYDGIQWDVVGMVWFAVGAKGLVAVQMGDLSETEFVESLHKRFGKSVQQDQTRTAQLQEELLTYLRGERQAFDISIDWSVMSPFQAEVLRQALQIPRGQVLTYGELANKIGKPKAARAVGRALGANPMPIILPCHRIVGANGDLTGYIGGLDAKAHLLTLEGYLS